MVSIPIVIKLKYERDTITYDYQWPNACVGCGCSPSRSTPFQLSKVHQFRSRFRVYTFVTDIERIHVTNGQLHLCKSCHTKAVQKIKREVILGQILSILFITFFFISLSFFITSYLSLISDYFPQFSSIHEPFDFQSMMIMFTVAFWISAGWFQFSIIRFTRRCWQVTKEHSDVSFTSPFLAYIRLHHSGILMMNNSRYFNLFEQINSSVQERKRKRILLPPYLMPRNESDTMLHVFLFLLFIVFSFIIFIQID